MNGRRLPPLLVGLALAGGLVALAVAPAGGQTPKRGGILNAMLGEDPPGFSIHESATISGVWPVMPCYSNLVLFDPLKPQETADTVIARAGRALVVAGQLPQPRLLPPAATCAGTTAGPSRHRT